VQPPRNNHQVGKRVKQTGLSISTGDSHAHQANAICTVGPKTRARTMLEACFQHDGPALAPPSRSGRHFRAEQPREGVDEHCINESDQANRAISTGKLHTLRCFHTRPINVVVFHGSRGSTGFEVGFPLRCFQRLSRPYIATLLCRWRDNRSTRGTSIPVLSY
jgi:hypothetical protein